MGEQGAAGWRKKYMGKSMMQAEMGTIEVQDLNIAWASDDTQWKIDLATDDNRQTSSKKKSSAEAVKVMWFEVKAKYEDAKAGCKYKIGFNVSLKENAFGWEDCPVFLMVKIGSSGSYTWKKLFLNNKDVIKDSCFDFPNDFDIQIPITAEDTTLHFGIYEVWSGRWKGGFIIHHAFIKRLV